MAGVMAVCLRGLAREAMIAAGGRGFMRFAPQGSALLVTDAIRRGDAQRLAAAFDEAGFDGMEGGGLLYLTPRESLIRRYIALRGKPMAKIDWESPLHPATAFAARLMHVPSLPLTPAGRVLIIDALRMTGRPGGGVMEELPALRARAAVMLRTQDRSGMRETGWILNEWCEEEERNEA